MKALIPYREEGTKSSLEDILNVTEREKLSFLMMNKIVDSLSKVLKESDIYVVSPDFHDKSLGINFFNSPIKLNKSLEAAIEEFGLPVLILPTDIPLVTEEDIDELISFEEDVVISPGEKGGTNALLLREKIPLKYSNGSEKSFIKHLDYLQKHEIKHRVFSNFNIYQDLDNKKDFKTILNNLDKNTDLYNWLKNKLREKNI